MKTLWELISKPRPLLMMISFILAGLSLWGYDMTGIKFFLYASPVLFLYCAFWAVVLLIFAWIINPIRDIKNKKKNG